MGRDKALLPVHGRTLAEVVAGVVSAAAGPTTLVGGSRRIAQPQFAFLPDLYPGEGPLGGILTALESSSADWNLIVACDMPGLKVDFLRGLLDGAEECGADALVPAGPNGRLEPLCAVYHRNSRRGLSTAFARGVRKIAVALEEVRTVTWKVSEVSCFQNVNTPEEWAAYER
jgi:molybdopterin-guanine dinucleotide biosynthesis protein A